MQTPKIKVLGLVWFEKDSISGQTTPMQASLSCSEVKRFHIKNSVPLFKQQPDHCVFQIEAYNEGIVKSRV
jgi:hypothetical protein